MNRRRFLTGAASLLAAPAIVRASSLMPVHAVLPPRFLNYWIVGFDAYGNRVKELIRMPLRNPSSLEVAAAFDGAFPGGILSPPHVITAVLAGDTRSEAALLTR